MYTSIDVTDVYDIPKNYFFTDFDEMVLGKYIAFTYGTYLRLTQRMKDEGIDFRDIPVTKYREKIPDTDWTYYDFCIALIYECKINVFFYLTEICGIEIDAGKYQQVKAMMEGKHSILYNPPKTGVTTMMTALMTYISRHDYDNSAVYLISGNIDSQSDIISKYYDRMSNIPYKPLSTNHVECEWMAKESAQICKCSKRKKSKKVYLFVDELESLSHEELEKVLNWVNDKSCPGIPLNGNIEEVQKILVANSSIRYGANKVILSELFNNVNVIKHDVNELIPPLYLEKIKSETSLETWKRCYERVHIW